MSVTAQVVGRGISYKSDLKNTIDYMYRNRQIATQESIAHEMGCSARTVQRLMTERLSITRQNNDKIKRENKIEKVIEWIDLLTSDGNSLKMRSLKDMTKIRDYSILKEAIHRYENQL